MPNVRKLTVRVLGWVIILTAVLYMLARKDVVDIPYLYAGF